MSETTTDTTEPDQDATEDASSNLDEPKELPSKPPSEKVTPEGSDVESDPDDEPDTFPRAYVERLRGENAKYRQRAGEADTLAQRLHTELVRATGRLADPTDLPFDPEHLADEAALTAAVDALLAAKPHLATRRPVGDVGQGNRGPASAGFSLVDVLKSRT